MTTSIDYLLGKPFAACRSMRPCVQVREENGQLAVQLAQSERSGRELQQANEHLEREFTRLQGQKRQCDAAALQFQTSFIEASKKLEQLAAVHERTVSELHQERQRVQVGYLASSHLHVERCYRTVHAPTDAACRERCGCMKELITSADDADSDLGSLLAQVQDLKNALATADETMQARCRSVAVHCQARYDERVAELLHVQHSLQSQLESMRAQVEETSAHLEISSKQVSKKQRSHAEDAKQRTDLLATGRQHTAKGKDKAGTDQLVIQGKDNEIMMLHDQARYSMTRTARY